MSLSCFRSKRGFAAAALLLSAALSACVAKSCPDGQKLQTGKCVDTKRAAAHGGMDSGMPEPDGGMDADDAAGDAEAATDAEAVDAQAPDAAGGCDPVQALQCWQDRDGDGYAATDAASMSVGCETKCPSGWTKREPVVDDVDCKDSDAKVRPRRCWRDTDMDGFAGNAHDETVFCVKECGSGWTAKEPKEDDVDCSDTSASFNPDAVETCNGKDNDCDGKVDEGADEACIVQNGSGDCVKAACEIGECKTGFGDCDESSLSGCEQQLDTARHCGGCGVACDVLATCAETKKENVGQCKCQAPAFGDGETCHGPGPMAGGWRWTCAIDSTKAASCWGLTSSVTSIPDGKYLQLATGQFAGCGITDDSHLHCWGSANIVPGETKYIQVVVGNEYICALTADHGAICWGYGTNGAAHGETDVPDKKFVQLAGGFHHVCGLGEDGKATCWGAGSYARAANCNGSSTYDCGQGQPLATNETFVQLVAGTVHTCGLKADGSTSCWGIGKTSAANPTEFNYGQSVPPSDELMWISAGAVHNCGIRKADGMALCWGAGKQGAAGASDLSQSVPVDASFLMLTSGWYHTCGLTTQNKIVCWGNNIDGQAPATISGSWPLVPGAQ